MNNELEIKKLWSDNVYDIWWAKGWDNYARIERYKEENKWKIKQLSGIKIPPNVWTLMLIIFTSTPKKK